MKTFSGISVLARPLGLGLFMACIGFSFALATAGNRNTQSAGTGLSGREVSSNFVRQRVTLVSQADLGVVVAGSQFTRQIIGQLGFKPYKFFFGDPLPASALVLSESGTLSGKVGDGADTAVVTDVFEVRVSDSSPILSTKSSSRLYSIRTVLSRSGGPLVFVTPLQLNPVAPIALNTAVANEPYSFTVQANGGKAPYKFALASELDFANLPAGLSLNENGAIFGKPIVPLSPGLPFTLSVVDSLGSTALKTFSLDVLPGTISSDFVATAGAFKLRFGREGDRDTLKLKVVVNKADLNSSKIRTVSDLAGVPFEMEFGGIKLPPALVETAGTGTTTGSTKLPNEFSRQGKIKFPNARLNIFPEAGVKLRYAISFNPKSGTLTANFSNINLIAPLGANFSTFRNPIIPAKIKIGKAVASDTTTATATSVNLDKTDVIRFAYKRSSNSGSGTARANDKRPPGGLFLITSVKGKESITKNPSLASPEKRVERLTFRVRGFMHAPNGDPIVFQPEDFVAILFGPHTIGLFPASTFERKDGKLIFVNTDPSKADIKSIVINNKDGKVEITTFDVNPKDVFGVDILEAGIPFNMPITITIAPLVRVNLQQVSFDGQSATAVFRKGSTIINK